MKKGCFNLRQRSRWLLVSLFALLAGGSPSWAQVTDDFSSYPETTSGTTLGDNWVIIGTDGNYSQFGTGKDYQHNNSYGDAWVASSSNNNYTKGIWLVLKKQVTGTVSFKATNGYQWGALTIYVSKAIESGTSYAVTGEASSYSVPAKTSSEKTYEFDAGDTPTYIAFCLVGTNKNLKMWSVTYTEAVEEGDIDKPTDFTASNITYNSAQLGWTAGGEETAWQLIYSTNASVDKDAETPIDITDNPYTLTNLTPETTYYAYLRAKSGESVSAWTSKISFTTLEQYVKPTDLAVAKQGTNATLSWTAGGTESAWDVVYSTNSSDNPDNLSATTVNAATHTLTDLTVGTTYYVWVRANHGSEGSGWINTSFTLAYSTPAPTSVDGDGITNVTYGSGAEVVNYGTSKTPYYQDNSAQLGAVTAGSETIVAITFSTGFTYGTVVWVDWNQNYEFEDSEIVFAGECTKDKPNTLNATFTVPAEQAAGIYRMRICAADTYYDSHKTMETAAGADPDAKSTYCVAQDYTLKVKEAAAYAMSVSDTDIAFGTVKNTTTTKTFTIINDGDNALENVSVVSSDSEIFTVSETGFDIPAEGSKVITVTFVKDVAGDYSETITISQANVANKVINVTATYEAPSPASIAITIAEAAVGETVAFGNVGKEAVKTFTVTNDGDQTLNVTIASNNTTDFTVSPAELAVTGHSSETFTVTFVYPTESPVLDAEKTANITVTASNEGIEPVEFAVTGTRIEQWSEDFSGNALPDGWETTSTTYWTFNNGYAAAGNKSTSYYLITPSLTVEAGQSLSFDVMMTETMYTTMSVEKQKGNGSWANVMDINKASLDNAVNSWKTITIDGLEAGNYKFRFNARGFNLDNFVGFKLNVNDPKLGIYSDAECTAAVATSVSKNFGFATETQIETYYIKNDGTGTMTLSLGDAPAGITQNLDKTSVAAGEHATLTITMPVENKGYNGGNVVVTATDLGTFTVAVSGVIVDEDKLNLNFATDNIPATWTANSWSKNANGYLQTSSSSNLETSKLTATAGEEIVIVAKQAYSGSSYTFGVNYKKVGAAEWSTLIASSSLGNSNWITLHASIAEAGDYLFQFVGYYAQIQRIYGLSVPQEPVMVVYDGESLAAATYNFGNVSDEADATWTLTVKNEGKAELTGLAAALTGDNADHYSVEVSAETVAVNGTATITVTQLKDYVGAHAATLTISADDPIADKVITLSGSTYDHNKLFVDFENNAFPAGWSVGTSWTVTTPYSSTAHHAQQSSFSTASALTTTPLTVGENEKLTFDAARLYSSSTPELKVRYTTNGGITWSEYVDFASQVTTSDYMKLELTDVPAGTAMVEFYGRYIKIDNIYGFTPTTAPVMALTESNVAVENGSTKEFGMLTAAATATYVLSNTGNGDLVSTLSSDVVTFEVTSMGEDVTLSENTLTIPAGKSATIVVTMPYAAPFEAKNGSLTITSTGWVAPVTLNYTATLVDETALYEDFAGNAKPAGWYQESSGWLFTQGAAHVYTGVDKEIITEKYGAEDGKNVLSFDAKRQYTSLDGELKVYTSTDRQEWTLAKTVTLTAESQTVTLDALADGEYYVKFVSLNASIDNLAGLKKLTAPEHDLYVTATTFPTTTLIPETENGVSASATVYSLRADETGVVAKLFFDEEEVATVTHSVDVNDYYTFSLTCNVPATEKTYAAKIVVYYSDETVAWESQTTNVVVSQTRTLQITDFARTSDETVDADANNQFTSTFNVTVNNNGTVAQDAANVSVSITDADGNVIGENATSWTVANSQTMFIVPGEYANDNAVLAIYRFNTNEDAEWAELTKISNNLYSTELNNKANFIIVRLKNSENDGYVADNNGLNWSNMYNQSVDITPGTYNCFTFKGWDDKNGDNHYFDYSTMAQLPVGASITMSVSVTTSALEGGEFTFKAKENMSNTVSTASATVTVNAAAPKFALYQDATPVNNGDDVQFGIVKGTKNFTFTIINEGNKMMEKPAIAVPDGFEANYVAADGTESDWMLFFYKENTVDADQGNFKATETEGKYVLENVNVPASGVNFAVHKKDGGNWYDTYGYSDEGGHLDATIKATKLATATSASGWMTIAAGTYDFIWNTTDLTLTAKPAGAILAGESADVNVMLKADQGKVSGDLIFTYSVDATNDKTFTLALSGRSISDDTWAVDFEDGKIPANWDNSNGWSVYETDGNNVARLTGWDAKAIITPRLAAEKDDILTFDVLSLGNSISYAYSTDRKSWSEEVTITATGEQTFTAPETGNYYLRITARNAYVDNFVGFKLNPNTLELDETVEPELAEEFYETITLNRKFVAGWNTVCLPFEISNVTGVFGANAKAYDFTDYTNEGELNFQVTSSLEAGKPYIVYVENDINDAIILSNTTISSTTASGTEWNGVSFQGTYAPKAKGSMTGMYGVTSDGYIKPAGEKASIKGFRAYFDVPDGSSVKALVFDGDDATAIEMVNGQSSMVNEIYNVAGQRVQKMQKGINIVNGKKILK